jgi:hypothetical protein
MQFKIAARIRVNLEISPICICVFLSSKSLQLTFIHFNKIYFVPEYKLQTANQNLVGQNLELKWQSRSLPKTVVGIKKTIKITKRWNFEISEQ